MKILFLIFLFLKCSTPEKIGNQFLKVPKVTSFTGKNLTDGTLTVIGRKDRNILNITNEYEKFLITVPYSEDWIFQENSNSILTTSSEKANLMVSVSKEQNDGFVNPRNFLPELGSRIESRIGIPLLGSRIIDSESNSLLFYFVKNPDLGYKSFHYWSIRQNKNFQIIKLHISFNSGDYTDLDQIDKAMKIFMDTGFKVF
jgi:hypothetical protein